MPDIRHSIQITAKAEGVYPLVATAQGFAQWWAADVSENEGAVVLGFFNRNCVPAQTQGESAGVPGSRFACWGG